MASQIVQLSCEELWTAIEDVDPVGAVLDEVAAGADPRRGWRRLLRPAHPELRLSAGRAGGLAALEERGTGVRYLLPAAGLRDIRTAALAALAARHLTASRVVTAAVLGWGGSAELQLAVLARCVPAVTHVAICAAAGTGIGRRIPDQLRLSGTGLSITERTGEAVRGANLVHVLDPGLLAGQPGRFAKGAVLVNGAGRALPDEVVAGVDQVYVDDRALLPRTTRRAVEADLAQLVTGTHPGRTRLDDVVLVELLGTAALSAGVAGQVHRSAVRRGLGTRHGD